jgi:sterol desaturase/sphingolipid hydroxylase (fatty acid hydroxylase superfamily)
MMTMPWERIESDSYWLVFVACFILIACWESWRPKTKLIAPVGRRWSRHGLIMVVTALFTVSVCRVGPVIMALAVAKSRYGLLNKPWLPYPLRFILAVLLLDLVTYTMHWSYHAVPILWRVHHVHHSDPDFDVSTAGRAHPLEVSLLQGANLAAVALLAAPPAAVLTVELLSVAQTVISHANASLPSWLEKPMRWFFITPDLHRIHHSEVMEEQWTNYGDIFPWWDYLFRTYRKDPAAGQENIVVGIKGFQNEASVDLGFMLLFPFRRQPEEAAAAETTAVR